MNSAPAPLFVVLACTFLLASFSARVEGTIESAGEPVGVSPGDSRDASATDPCPSFSWAPVSSAIGYELAVYGIDSERVESDPVLSQVIAGAALGWTPSLERCLSRGQTYAWSVRAQTESGLSEWSKPLFFEVPNRPSDRELVWAVEVIRRHTQEELAAGGRPAELDLERNVRIAADHQGGITRLASRLVTAGSSSALLRVAGEVRTIDPDDPGGRALLWGRGRVDGDVHGTGTTTESPCTQGPIRYGLSTIMVDWGSAADACPAGTWVCRSPDIGACDTTRFDAFGTLDGITCSGGSIDHAASDHVGWVADRADASSGVVRTEQGTVGEAFVCTSYPVWCCWK